MAVWEASVARWRFAGLELDVEHLEACPRSALKYNDGTAAGEYLSKPIGLP